MLDTVCARRKTIRIAQNDFPTEVVKSQFLKLNAEHIQYVLDRMRQNTTEMGNAAKRFVFQSAANQGGTDAARLFRSFAEVVEKASGMGCRTYKAPALSR